jgi:hypothetical protein
LRNSAEPVRGIYRKEVALSYFMEAVAKHNGWQAVKEFNSHWRFATIRHAKLRGADALANLIQKSLRQSEQHIF